MAYKNLVFLATSLDGFIADKDGGLDWLNSIPNPDNLDLGYESFLKRVDAIVMGRNTFETVCGFDIGWPYSKPVFVLSNTLSSLKEEYRDKAQIVKGPLPQVMDQIHALGYSNLYIDGGKTVGSFLQEDLIDEIIISLIPIILGGGIPLFGTLPGKLEFEHVETEVYLDAIVQNKYKRKRLV